MIKQIWKLSKVQICNLFGFNTIRFTKDESKKARYVMMSLVWLLLIAMFVFYVILISNGLIGMGMGEIIPMYLFVICSLVILCFTFLKAGSVIFQMNSYEILSSLPVSNAAIVISRFFTMYVTNVALSLIMIIPGMIIYGLSAKPGALFYIFGIIGIMFLPMLPMIVATAVGAAITAISSRLKHKSLMSAALSIILVVVVMAGSVLMPQRMNEMTQEMMQNLVGTFTIQLGKVYPPALWFQNGLLSSSVTQQVLNLCILIAVSAVIFVVMIAAISKPFGKICAGLNSTSAKNNYKMTRLSRNSVVKAMWKRELKRYFASSIYVTNTIIGYIMMLAVSVALFVMGADKLESALQMPGVIRNVYPVVLAFTAIIMPTTSCSISLEGKNWWMIKTLPLNKSDIFKGKILLNVSLAAPFFIISVALAIIGLKASLLESLCLIVFPLTYIFFASVVGLLVNLKFPVMEWENEVRIVKQSSSTMVTMLIDMVSEIIPIFLILSVSSVYAPYIMLVISVFIAAVAIFLWKVVNKVDILKI